MRKLISLLPLFTLAGCVGPNTNELLQEPPTRVVLTSATPDQARECIVALDPAHYIPTPIQGGWKVIDTQQGAVEQAEFVVTIFPTGSGSRIEYHLGHSPVVGQMPDYLKPCLDKLPPA